MTVVSLIGIEKSFGSWPVLRGADLEVGEGARIGIVGPNGAGKSTLLRILSGEETPGAGEVVHRKQLVIATLEQNPDGDDRTAEQTVMAARPDIAALDADLRAVEGELARPEVVADLSKMDRVLVRQQELLDRWVEAGGPGLSGEARSPVGVARYRGGRPRPADDVAVGRPTQAGGAGGLPDPAAGLLLLDEPETHLDADRRAQLEAIVAEFAGAVVTVSHDRYMLDETVSRIAELEEA